MAIQLQLQSFSQLEHMVSTPTWKDILLDLIASHRVDPWNVDILQLSDAFIKRVREMESFDFVLEANVILAAAILLKYKSNYLSMLNYQSGLQEFIPEGVVADAGEELPELTLSSRIPPRRQITLNELVSEMERIIKYENVERSHAHRGVITETLDLELQQGDVERDMQQLLGRIKDNTDSEGWSIFSRLVDGCEPRGVVYSLVCLLHLVQMESVDIRQDELFGEIFIKLLGGNTA
jgi:segregation and condensation protein A